MCIITHRYEERPLTGLTVLLGQPQGSAQDCTSWATQTHQNENPGQSQQQRNLWDVNKEINFTLVFSYWWIRQHFPLSVYLVH